MSADSAEPRVEVEGAVVVEAVRELDAVRDEWSQLAQETGSIFSTWEWASVWLRRRRAGHELLLRAIRDPEGSLRALVPLYLWSTRPFRIARFVGHGPADELGPVWRAGEREAAARATWEIAERERLDLVLAELLPSGEEWRHALGCGALAREASPTASLEGGWDAYISRRSANFRQQLRQRERRLGDRYDVRFRLATEADRLESDIDLLFDLHARRWSRSSPFVRWESFHREFARIASERGWLRLWVLELDERPVAAWYGFRFAGVESYYQAGRDPAASEDSVGFILLAHTIREAAGDGMREYHFLRGDEPFKARFADGDRGLETLACMRGVRGRIAAEAMRMGLRSTGVQSVVRSLRPRRERA
jgi:CelD/BcsL family acetyltransferase involved in cellulose biosynthesis